MTNEKPDHHYYNGYVPKRKVTPGPLATQARKDMEAKIAADEKRLRIAFVEGRDIWKEKAQEESNEH